MTATEFLTAIPLILAGLGGLAGLVAVFRVGPERRKIAAEADKSGADAADVLSKAAVGLLEPAREQVQFLSAELKATRKEVTELRMALADMDFELQAARRDRKEVTDLRTALAALNIELQQAREEMKQLRGTVGDASDPMTKEI